MCVYLCAFILLYVYVGVGGGSKRVLDLLELELQVDRGHSTWVLWFGSSARSACILNCLFISPALVVFYNFKMQQSGDNIQIRKDLKF